MRKYIYYFLGMTLLGISFNMIFLPNQFFSYNFLSFGILANDIITPVTIIYSLNAFIYLISYIFLDDKRRVEIGLSVFALPLAIYLTSFIPNIFLSIDKLQQILVGSILTGYGYGLIYKYDLIADGMDIITYVLRKKDSSLYKYIKATINVVLLIISFLLFGFENTIYATIIYFIINTICNKVNLGISDSKTFCIVTEKYKEISKYIMENLNENITMVDVEGGFSKKPKKMIMTVISTNDYYMLKEMVKELDNEAFITIVDSYQVIAKKRKKENCLKM